MASEPQLGTVIEVPEAAQLHAQIAELDKALKENLPQMDSLLQTLHKNLSTDPQLVHLLKEEEIAVLFRGLEIKTRTKILEETVKSASSGRGNKKLSKLGEDDLGMG